MIIGIDGNEANIQNRVGVNQYAAEVLIALEKLPEAKDHEFVIYLKDKPLPHLPLARKGWRYEVLPAKGLWVIRMLMPYLWTTRQKPDVFFTPSHYAPPFLPMPLVMSIMDLGYLSSKDQFRKYDFYQLKYWGAWSIKTAKKIIAISQSTKKEIETYYPEAKNKIAVTLLGYDKQKFKAKNKHSEIDKIKNKYGIKGDYVVFISTLKPNKNIEGIIEGFSKCNNKNLQLVIAGKKGWLYESIFAKVQELQLEAKVIFTDFLPEEEKVSLLSGAKAFLAPSFWEGFGIHILEAMAIGIPVVTSNLGSIPEVTGDAAVLVDPYNTDDIARGIDKAVKNYASYSKKGISQAQKFSWENTAQKTLKVLESAV